jgi:hypothetical protein
MLDHRREGMLPLLDHRREGMLPLQAVSTDHAGTVCVWHVASGKLRFAFANTHGGCRISAATFDSNHRRLITGVCRGCSAADETAAQTELCSPAAETAAVGSLSC